MSSFICEHCSTPIIDSPRGYVTGCGHYPKDGNMITRLVGIDPGTTTGFAISDGARLLDVTSCGIVEAFAMLEIMKGRVFVVYEDARLRTWFGAKGREALQGAGSIKRDCGVWEEWLRFHQIPHKAIRPQKGATKLDAERFRAVTGWTGRTNEHARDAAMLVYGMTVKRALSL